MRWANAGTELHDHIRGIGAEAFIHLSDRVCRDTEFGSFASGMHETNCRRIWIDDVDCATVGDVNAECDTALIRNNAIAAREFAAHTAAARAIDHSYFI